MIHDYSWSGRQVTHLYGKVTDVKGNAVPKCSRVEIWQVDHIRRFIFTRAMAD